MKQTKNTGITLILRNIKEINQVLHFVDRLSLKDLVTKYNVDNYVKEFKTVDLIKISILYFFSKEQHLKHFLKALLSNKVCCRLFSIPVISVQQVYKALKKRCWFFFYESFHLVSKELRNKESLSYRVFKGKEIKIIDSTFLTYALSRIFFAKFGYNPSEKKYHPGIKLHVLLDYSKNIIENFIETSGNTHDSKVADTVLKDVEDSILLFDKGYQNLKRFLELDSRNVTFIIPLRKKLKFEILETRKLDFETGEVIIQKIRLTNGMIIQYIKCLEFELLCNDCSLQWYEIVNLYSFRWEIESLFKKLKQLWKINKPLFRNHNSIMAFICITLMAAMIIEHISFNESIEIEQLYHTIGRKIEACLVINV
jgi:hypothetical protein